MVKRKVIIDCDPGIDDSLALLYAILHPDLDVVAITTVAGNVPLNLANDNTLICLEIAGRLDIPVYQGEASPISTDFVPDKLKNGFDGLGEANVSHYSTVGIQDKTATEFLSDYFKEKRDTSIITLGPLTNLAKSLEINPNICDNAYRVVTVACRQQDFICINYVKDKEAADFVYDIVKRPIEVVRRANLPKITITPNIIQYLSYLNKDMGLFLNDLLSYSFDYHWDTYRVIGHYIQEAFAISYFFENPSEFKKHDTHFNPDVSFIKSIDFFEDFISSVSLTDDSNLRADLRAIIVPEIKP